MGRPGERGRHRPLQEACLDQYKAAALHRKLMKECAADLSKVYGVAMVDGSLDGGRLQVERTRIGDGGRMSDHRMSDERTTDERTTNENNEPGDQDPDEQEVDAPSRPLGRFAAGLLF